MIQTTQWYNNNTRRWPNQIQRIIHTTIKQTTEIDNMCWLYYYCCILFLIPFRFVQYFCGQALFWSVKRNRLTWFFDVVDDDDGDDGNMATEVQTIILFHHRISRSLWNLKQQILISFHIDPWCSCSINF